MTAHAHVAHMLGDGQIRAVYVHHAEPAALIGPLLARHYHGAAPPAALLDLGDLSVLAATPSVSRSAGGPAGAGARTRRARSLAA